MIELQLTGLDALKKNMAAVTDDLRRKGGRFALRKASEIVVAAARANAAGVDDPATPESIAANITARWNGRMFRRTGDLGFRVGVLGGARGHAAASGEVAGKGKNNPGGDTYYWRFLEFGTSNIEAPARPFLRSALSDNVQAATDTFIREYTKSLDRVIKRMKK